MSIFNGWIELAEREEEDVFAKNPRYMLPGVELRDYVMVNSLALQLECAELIEEFCWKPWKHDSDGTPRAGRTKVIDEAVDVLHFLAHLLTSVRCTDEELSERYLRKCEINRQRQADGYSYKEAE